MDPNVTFCQAIHKKEMHANVKQNFNYGKYYTVYIYLNRQ